MKRVEDLLGGALLKRKLRQIGIWIVESFVAFVIDCSVHGCDMWGGEKPVAIVIHCSCEVNLSNRRPNFVSIDHSRNLMQVNDAIRGNSRKCDILNETKIFPRSFVMRNNKMLILSYIWEYLHVETSKMIM